MEFSLITILDNIHTTGNTKIFCEYLRDKNYCDFVDCSNCVFNSHNSLEKYIENENK